MVSQQRRPLPLSLLCLGPPLVFHGSEPSIQAHFVSSQAPVPAVCVTASPASRALGNTLALLSAGGTQPELSPCSVSATAAPLLSFKQASCVLISSSLCPFSPLHSSRHSLRLLGLDQASPQLSSRVKTLPFTAQLTLLNFPAWRLLGYDNAP